MRAPPLLVAALAIVAGCVSPAPSAGEESPAPATPAPLTFAAPVPVFASCTNVLMRCYEPTVAADFEGRLFVANGIAGAFARSDDGGASWRVLAEPSLPPPATPDAARADVLLQVSPSGALYYSALVTTFATLLGLHVAASSDGGESWDVNAMLALPSPDGQLGADRQWLAFGGGETVYAGYHHLPSTQVGGVLGTDPTGTESNDLRVARSDDAGRSWSDFVVAVPSGQYVGGLPLVEESGRFFYPTFAYASPGARLALVASEDDGASFHEIEVYAPEDSFPGDYFPSLVALGDGELAVAWRDPDHALRFARSIDGGATWSAPTTWSGSGERVLASPWMTPRADSSLDVVYNVEGPNGARLVHAHASATEGVRARSVVSERVAQGAGSGPGNTDFAHFARLPDGRLAVAWADTDAGILVALSK